MRADKRSLRNIIYIVSVIGTIYMMIFLFFSQNDIVINWTPSHVPIGLYRIIDTNASTYAVGDIVLFNIDELYRMFPGLTDTQFKTVSRTFMKIVGAVAGDKISKIENKVAINGKVLKNAEIHSHYNNGEPRCKIQYPLTIPSAYVWLITNTEFSFDSRYFGSIPEKLILAKVEELWTWE